MSQPPDGVYYIVSRQTTPDGKSLAISYNGVDAPITITEFEKLPTQLWDLVKHGEQDQYISPQDAPSLGVVVGNDATLVIKPLREVDHPWIVRGNETAYTVQDYIYLNFWTIEKVEVGEPVKWTDLTGGNKKQFWKLIPVQIKE